MRTLLLRLAGPLQSWGVQSRFGLRDTGLEPSKSGVIGLLCAALGRPREAAVDDLAALRMGVRVNREGIMQTDYQTVGGAHLQREAGYGVAQFDGGKPKTALSWRRYLADADFLVGLEASTTIEDELLLRLDAALAQPVWPLFLGRKAYVPGVPVRLPDDPALWGSGPRIVSHDLRSALMLHWPQPREGERSGIPTQLRAVIEYPEGDQIRMDVPVSFAPLDRRYRSRTVRTEWIACPPDVVAALESPISSQQSREGGD